MIIELASMLRNHAESYIWERMEPRIQEQALTKAASLSVAQFDTSEVHDLIERTARGNGWRVGRITWFVVNIISALVGLGSAFVLLMTYSPLLALVGCAVAVPMAIAGVRQGRHLHTLESYQSPGRRFTQYLGNLLSQRQSATELRAYQLLTYFLGRWRQSFAKRREDHLVVRWRSVVEHWLAITVAAALLLVALGGVVLLARSGRLDTGQVVVLVGAVRILQGGLTGLALNVGYLWQDGLPVGDLRRFLELPTGERPPAEGSLCPNPVGEIRFEDVHFAYPDGRPVLKGVSFTVAPGERIALVGSNGAGKSTLVKLLLGVYQPTAGRITLGGIDSRTIAPASWRAAISCVFQDFVRFDLTVAENVAAGRLDATRAEIMAALGMAGLADWVGSLPQGADTLLGRTFTAGIDLSGGQWQRIALARAFVRGAQVIILDEPTSALDPRAELAVFGKFIELVEGRTAFLISHRLGSARLADRILVLDDGRVAEEGHHDDLVARGGIYADFFRLQAQWYEDGGEVAS